MTWATYSITVDGHPPFVLGAASRGKALASAFASYTEHYRCKFGEFLRICRVRRCEVPENDGYDYVRRVYDVHPTVGQRVTLINENSSTGEQGVVVYPGKSTASVHVVIDGRDFAVRVHPSNVQLHPLDSTRSPRSA